MSNKVVEEYFITKANQIHNNKYSYKKINYYNSRTKICINCHTHGEFWQRPAQHLQGSGCPSCGKDSMKKTKELTVEQFIVKAKKIHSNKYNYSSVYYNGYGNKVIITCPIHGKFLQTPCNHLNGQGCFECYIEKRKYTKIEFIQKARIIHGDKYVYDKVNYLKNKIKVTIICPDHGEFLQTPNNHTNGVGCPACSSSKGELAIKAILDKYNIETIPQYMIPEVADILKYDFYLPEYNLLIEFHGRQHYEHISFFHDGDYTLSDQIRRDDCVRYNAIRWKYNYIEFNYKHFNLLKEQFGEFVITTILTQNFLKRNKK